MTVKMKVKRHTCAHILFVPLVEYFSDTEGCVSGVTTQTPQSIHSVLVKCCHRYIQVMSKVYRVGG